MPLPGSDDFFYISRDHLIKLKTDLKDGKDVTQEDMDELLFPETLSDNAVMVPVGLQRISDQFNDVEHMIEVLGPSGAINAFAAVQEATEAGHEDLPLPLLTLKRWRQVRAKLSADAASDGAAHPRGCLAWWELFHEKEHLNPEQVIALNAYCLAWNSDGSRLGAGSMSRRVGVYNVQSKTEVNQWNLREECLDIDGRDLDELGCVNCIAWSPSRNEVAIGIEQYGLRILSGDLAKVLVACGCNQMDVSSLSWSPDGRYLAAGGSSNPLNILDRMTGRNACPIRFPVPKNANVLFASQVAWSPQGSVLAVESSMGILFVDVDTWNVMDSSIPDINFRNQLFSWSWDLKGDHLLLGVRQNELLQESVIVASDPPIVARVVSVSTQIETVRVQPFAASEEAKYILSAMWSPTGAKLLFGSNDGSVSICDSVSGCLLSHFPNQRCHISHWRCSSRRYNPKFFITAWHVVANPSWTKYAVGYDDGVVMIHEMRSPVVWWQEIRLLAVAIYKPNISCPLSAITQSIGRGIIESVASYL